MKKNHVGVAVLYLLLFSTSLNAQTKGSVWLHPILGFNTNWILNQNAYGNPEMDYASSFGLSGGIGLCYFHKEDWAFDASLLISKLGQNYKGNQLGGDATRDLKFTYIELPLVMKKKISNSNNENTTWLSVGPDIMFLIKATQDYSRTGGQPLQKPENLKSGDIKDRIAPVDVALKFSAEKMYRLKRTDDMLLLIAFDSAIGLTDFNTKNWQIKNIQGDYSGSHNFYFGVKLGVMFNTIL